jgi:hypothetical protein
LIEKLFRLLELDDGVEFAVEEAMVVFAEHAEVLIVLRLGWV